MANSAQPASRADVVGDLPLDSWLRALGPGEKVWFTDPDLGLWSGTYMVDRIEGGAVQRNTTLVILRRAPGSRVMACVTAQASDLASTKPDALLPVIDDYQGQLALIGYAATLQQALDLGNAALDNMVVGAYPAKNLTMPDGEVVPNAWIASCCMAEADQA